MIDQKRLDEIEARYHAASDGPWIAEGPCSDEFDSVAGPGGGGSKVAYDVLHEGDAQFIAHARTDIPDMHAEIVRLNAENNMLKVVLQKIRDMAEFHDSLNTPDILKREFVLPKTITEWQICNLIEDALDLKLYGWQKDYIFGRIFAGPEGRGTGKTLAYILRLLLDWKADPIHLYPGAAHYRSIPDDLGNAYADQFRTEMLHICLKLENCVQMPLRKVYFTREEAIRK